MSKGRWIAGALVCLLLCRAISLQAEEIVIDLGLSDRQLQRYEYTANASGTERHSLTRDGQARSYYAYVPSTLNRAEPVPVLIALHGAGRDGVSMVDVWRRTAGKYGFVVLAPNGDQQNWNNRQADAGQIKAVLNDAAKRYGLSWHAVYLTGHSNGAVQALLMAASTPDQFRAVAVHAGTLPLAPQPGVQGQHLPVAIFLGDSDHIFSLTSARQNLAWLQARGFDGRLFVLKQHSHWYYHEPDRINAGLWSFMARPR